MLFSTTITRPLQLVTRALQWASAVIVMGLTSFFISRGPKGEHIIYQEVIVRLLQPLFTICKLTRPGRPLRRLLPPSIHLALPPYLPEQVRLAHRRCLLIPVCLSHSVPKQQQLTSNTGGSRPSSSPPKTTT